MLNAKRATDFIKRDHHRIFRCYLFSLSLACSNYWHYNFNFVSVALAFFPHFLKVTWTLAILVSFYVTSNMELHAAGTQFIDIFLPVSPNKTLTFRFHSLCSLSISFTHILVRFLIKTARKMTLQCALAIAFQF